VSIHSECKIIEKAATKTKEYIKKEDVLLFIWVHTPLPIDKRSTTRWPFVTR
jgi:hypothetical protein